MDFVQLYFWKCVYTELQSEGAMEVKIARFYLRLLIVNGLAVNLCSWRLNFFSENYLGSEAALKRC